MMWTALRPLPQDDLRVSRKEPTGVFGLFAVGVTVSGLRIVLHHSFDAQFHIQPEKLPAMEWDVFWITWAAFLVGSALIWLLLTLIGRMRVN
jgi:hypothetical protein